MTRGIANNYPRCRDKNYVAELRSRLDEPHIVGFTDLVKQLKSAHPDAYVPFVAPTYGGVHARMLSLFEAPWKERPSAMGNSGMLCTENTDGAARRHKEFLGRAGIDVSDIVSWNAFPWSGDNSRRTTADVDAALGALDDVIALLPDLRVVMVHGTTAQRMWEAFCKRYPEARSGLHAIKAPSTSEKLIDETRWEPAQIARFDRQLRSAFTEAAGVLRRDDGERGGTHLDFAR